MTPQERYPRLSFELLRKAAEVALNIEIDHSGYGWGRMKNGSWSLAPELPHEVACACAGGVLKMVLPFNRQDKMEEIMELEALFEECKIYKRGRSMHEFAEDPATTPGMMSQAFITMALRLRA